MKVLLIGDSIRGGYQQWVRKGLGRRARVVWPDANCGHSLMIRENFNEWIRPHKADVIHFNAGIWDLSWLPGESVTRVTIGAYARSLRILVARLKAEPGARLIWASTTPVLRPRWDSLPKGRCRPAAVVRHYNAAAAKVMKENRVRINDLYGAIMKAGVHDCVSDDGVHMTPFGSKVLADAVTRAVLR